MDDSEITQEFPINSQTSPSDKRALLQLRSIMQQHRPRYRYLEIGSFLGGSLTPFLRDPHCEHILSIDQRNRQQPDERGVRYDYVGISHDTMLENLKAQQLDIRKLETFDGSVDCYPEARGGFDLLFIDGEHTDYACFRDYVHSQRLLKEDAIVAFHDSTLVHKAIRMIQEQLRAARRPFRFFKVHGSEVSCLFQGALAALAPERYLAIESDLAGFYEFAEKSLLSAVIKNRLAINLSLRDMPVTRAY